MHLRRFWPASTAAFVLLIFAALFSRAVQPPEHAATALAQVVPTLQIEQLGKGISPLDGPWQFHIGDDARWAAPAVDDATGDGGWEQISADEPWGSQGHPAYTGYAWYRRHLHLSPATGADANFALMLRRVDDVYEIYWNGKLVGSNGVMPPNPVYYYTQPPKTFGLGPLRDGALAIRVWKAPLKSFDSDGMGGIGLTPLIGGPEAIADHQGRLLYAWLRSRQYTFGVDSLYGLVMILSLIAWYRNRSRRVLLAMALFCFAPPTSLLLVGLRLPISAGQALGWLQPVLGVQDIGLWFLLLELLLLGEDARLKRITKWLAIISISVTSMDGMLTMLDWSKPHVSVMAQVLDAVFTAVFTTAELYPLVLVWFAFRKKLDSMRWILAIAAFLAEMLSVVRIGAQQGNRFTHWTLGARLGSPLFYVNGNAFTLQTIFDTLLFLAILYAAVRYSQENDRQQHALLEEFKSARELQQVLIPETLPSLPWYAVTSAYKPAQEVGGDFFQILPLEGRFAGSTMIVLGDVSGKGLRAAMTVSMIVGAVRTLVETVYGPAEVLAGLNRRVFNRLQGAFVTCVALRLDPRGLCVIASAGHPAPFANGQEMHLAGSLPLGLIPNISYEEKQFFLRVGDRFTLYTDGLLEARSKSGELYGFDRLQQLFAAHPDAAMATDAAVAFGQEDDITVVTLTRLALGVESTTTLTIPMLSRTAV